MSITSDTAEVGDELALGTFTKSGSPATDKEPFTAFRRPGEHDRAVSLREGDTLMVLAPAGWRDEATLVMLGHVRGKYVMALRMWTGTTLLSQLPPGLTARVVAKGMQPHASRAAA